MNAKAVAAIVFAGFAVMTSACTDSAAPATERVGDPDTGRALIAEYGCGSCHAVPGVEGADGVVGPPLDNIGERKVIAGRLANTPENMILWISDPQEVEPGTAMPDMGIDPEEARHIAAYLRGLR